MTSFAEVVENVRYVAAAVGIAVIADADTGYGNALNVARTVREYEEAGCCGPASRGSGLPEALRHSSRASRSCRSTKPWRRCTPPLDARTDPDFVIIARTDALAPHGWDEALERVHAYRDAGADLVFVDGIKHDRRSRALWRRRRLGWSHPLQRLARAHELGPRSSASP